MKVEKKAVRSGILKLEKNVQITLDEDMNVPDTRPDVEKIIESRGELPAMVMIDAVSRLVPGVLNNEESAEFESFHDNLLEHPQYTRPVEFHGKRVPDVLLSGHHGNVDKWRREQSLKRTLERRPDLLEQADLSKDDEKYLKKLKKDLHDQA